MDIPEAARMLHRLLEKLGKLVGQLTVLALAITVLFLPGIAMLLASIFAAFGIEALIGGGWWVIIPAFWIVGTLIGIYVPPHVKPQIDAALLALLKSKGFPMDYRGIDYSMHKNDDGTWRWTLHPKIVPNVMTKKIDGVASTESEATDQIKAAIDKHLEQNSN